MEPAGHRREQRGACETVDAVGEAAMEPAGHRREQPPARAFAARMSSWYTGDEFYRLPQWSPPVIGGSRRSLATDMTLLRQRYVSSQMRHRFLLFPKLPPGTDAA